MSIFDQLAAGEPEPDKQPETEQSIEQPLEFEENTRTGQRLREALQALLADGVLEQERKPNLYRTAFLEQPALNALIEPLDFSASVDEVRGLVFLRVLREDNADAEDDWSHPLVRRQRLTLEQSLLLAVLRQQFVNHEQEAGVGDSNVLVAVDELVAAMQSFLGDSGSETKERERVLTLLNQLKNHAVVTDPDEHGRVRIRPLIAHLANPENLQALLHQLKSLQQQHAEQES